MAKYIGVKMIEAVPMTAAEAKEKGYQTSNFVGEDPGYEVTYENGYKSWSPADVFEAAYFELSDEKADTVKDEDVQRFIIKEDNYNIENKNVVTNLVCVTGFQTQGFAGVVNPENFDIKKGIEFARPKAEDKIWFGLGFVLQWAKYGLNGWRKCYKEKPNSEKA